MIARLNAYAPLKFPVPTPAYNFLGDAASDAQAQTEPMPSSWLIGAALVAGVSLFLVLSGRRR